MGSCFSCQSMLFQNTFLKVLRHKLQEQLVEVTTGYLTELQSRQGEGGIAKGESWNAVRSHLLQAIPLAAQSSSVLHTAHPRVTHSLLQDPRMPRSHQYRLTPHTWCTPVTKPAFCTRLPRTPSTSSEHILLQPWDAPSSLHGSRLAGSKHTSLFYLNPAALSVHHLCFSSRQTKQHRSPGFEKDDTQMKWTTAARCSQRGKVALRSEASSASVIPRTKVKF